MLDARAHNSTASPSATLNARACGSSSRPAWRPPARKFAPARILLKDDTPSDESRPFDTDNLNTHTGAALYQAFPPAEAKRLLDKLELHYPSQHASWLDMAEIEFSVLSRQCLDRRIPDKATLAHEVEAWVAERNRRFTTADARIHLMHLYPSITE